MRLKKELFDKPNYERLGDEVYPSVYLDSRTHTMIFKGPSVMVEPRTFYDPIFDWIKGYCLWVHELSSRPRNGRIRVKIVFDMDMLNSASGKCLYHIVRKIDELERLQKVDISLQWYYDESDEIMKEWGMEMKNLFLMDFFLIKN